MKSVKLIIEGHEHVLGKANNEPCKNCQLRLEDFSDEDFSEEEVDVVCTLCAHLGEKWRVIDISYLSKPATLNYTCGSMGEEIEQ